MHPLSLLIYWVWLKGRFEQVDLAAARDMSRSHAPLIVSGAVIVLIGAALIALIAANWNVCVAAATLSGAATAVTAAGGVALIGLTLVYAGLPQRRAVRSRTQAVQVRRLTLRALPSSAATQHRRGQCAQR